MATKTTHTPDYMGCASIDYGVGRFTFKSPRQFFTVNGDIPKSEEKRRAIIDLISAAPDLLAALKECMGVERDIDPGVMDRARAAITKAEGR